MSINYPKILRILASVQELFDETKKDRDKLATSDSTLDRVFLLLAEKELKDLYNLRNSVVKLLPPRKYLDQWKYQSAQKILADSEKKS